MSRRIKTKARCFALDSFALTIIDDIIRKHIHLFEHAWCVLDFEYVSSYIVAQLRTNLQWQLHNISTFFMAQVCTCTLDYVRVGSCFMDFANFLQ